MRIGANSIHAVVGPERIVLWDCWPIPFVGLEVDPCQRAHQLPLHVDQGIVKYRCKWTTTNFKTRFIICIERYNYAYTFYMKPIHLRYIQGGSDMTQNDF